MNPERFALTQPSACFLGREGDFGPDRITKYTYDTVSRIERVTSGFGVLGVEGIDIQMTYTDNGQVESRGDGENHFTMYAYDGHDRLERIDFEGPAFELFGYDAIANKTEYGFDERGYLESSKINGYLVTYLNDAAGRVTDVTYPHDQVIEYFYDDANAVTDIVAHQGFNTHTVADYGYDTMGRVTDVDFGDGGSTTYAYDPIGRLKDHSLKRAGQVPFNLTTLAYNPSSQIVSRSVTQSSYQTAMPTSSPAQYTPNNLNQYTFADGSLSYDLNGNLTAYDGWTYAFDAHNRMKSASGPGTSLTLAYDPTGRLNSTTLASSTTEYVYSGDQLIGEYTQAGNPVNLYVYPPGSDIPIARFSGSQGLNDFQYLRSDERGSIVAVTDEIVLDSNQYDVYGVPLDGSSSLFRYTGQIMLPGTELYHYKARVYHPGLGRFMQTDPIGYGDGMNMYAYVGNDPVNGVDPTGLAQCTGSLSESQCNQGLDTADAAKADSELAAEVLSNLSSKIGENAEISEAEQGVLDAVENRFGKKLTSAKNLNRLAKRFANIAEKIGVRGEGVKLKHGQNRTFGRPRMPPAYVLSIFGGAIYLNDNFFASSETFRNHTMVHEAAHLAKAGRDSYIGRGQNPKAGVAHELFNSGKQLRNADTYACQIYPSICGF